MPEKKSIFVTVVSWIFIIFAGFSTVIAGFQNIMLNIMFDGSIEEKFPMNDPEMLEQIPAFASFMFSFMFSNFELIAFLFFLLPLATLLVAIGLLKRKNWARLIFIGILGLGIILNLSGLIFQQSMVSEMMDIQSSIQVEGNVVGDDCCESNKDISADADKKAKADEFQESMKNMESIIKIMMLFSIAFTLVIFAITGWVIWKLVSPSIVAEFD